MFQFLIRDGEVMSPQPSVSSSGARRLPEQFQPFLVTPLLDLMNECSGIVMLFTTTLPEPMKLLSPIIDDPFNNYTGGNMTEITNSRIVFDQCFTVNYSTNPMSWQR